MKFNNYMFILLIFIIFLLGCQQVQEVSEQETDIIEISSEKVVGTIYEELEKEFDDGLDEALAELEEVENI